MAQIETWLKTDLKQIVKVKELDGQLFTADNQANLIGVIVTDKGLPATLSGLVNGYIIRSDGETVVVTGAIEENRAYIILPASAYVKAGPIHIVIKVGTTTIGACTGFMGMSSTDTIVDPGHVIPSLAELLEQIENCRQATEAAEEAAEAADEAAEAADDAAGAATDAAQAANTAAGQAASAAQAANTAAAKIDGMTVSATGLPAGQNPTVSITEDATDGHKKIAFGLVKGDKGDKGNAGKDFRIKKTFSSIAAMEAYDPDQDPSPSKVTAYDFVMIDTGSVEDPDTGKLYCYEPEETTVWHYIGDLSGAQGIKGETGTGVASVQLNQDYTLTLTLDDGTSYTLGPIRGAQGATGPTGPTGATGPQGPQGPKGDTGDSVLNGVLISGDDYLLESEVSS